MQCHCSALNILQRGSNLFMHLLVGAQSAWEMLKEEESLGHITTSCSELDDILGGGISCKEVTEIG